MDIDTAFRNAMFNEETIVKMICDIISIKINDNVNFNFLGITSIRDEDEYGGFRVNIQVELENIKELFHIDIAIGDPITPKAIRYKYKPILGKKYIDLQAYNIETILAEKIETILSRAELNGRMRDFYDVYLIYIKDFTRINIDNFRKAIAKTFFKRGYVGDTQAIINLLRDSQLLRSRWRNYQRKYDYAKRIDFDDIMNCLEKIINVITVNKVVQQLQ